MGKGKRFCWHRGCRGDTGDICDYCGKHDGEPMLCCRADWPWNHPNCPKDRSSYNSQVYWHHQCVLPRPGVVLSAAPKSVNSKKGQRWCWHSGCGGDTGKICDYCGKHEGKPMLCCRANWPWNAPNCPKEKSEYNSRNYWHHQCVLPRSTESVQIASALETAVGDEEEEDAVVLCDGQPEDNYCDGYEDCFKYPEWCSCPEAKALCDANKKEDSENDVGVTVAAVPNATDFSFYHYVVIFLCGAVFAGVFATLSNAIKNCGKKKEGTEYESLLNL